MYALVMWIGDEPTTSVVLWTDVEVSGKKTRAKWGPKYWPVQVLRQSADKNWLESLSVIANGQVIWGRSEEQNGNAPKKRKLNDDENANDVGKKADSSSPQTSKNMHGKPRIGNVIESDEDDDSLKKNHSNEENDSDEKTEKNDSDETNDSDEKDDSDAKNDSDDKVDSEDSDSSGTDDSITTVENEVCKVQPTPNYLLQCTLCPKVTPEILAFMKYLVKHLEASLKEQQKSSTVAAEPIPSKGKSELIPGSDIWIRNVDLIDIKKTWVKRPKEMVRRLMRAIVNKETLKTMSPTGRGSHKAIPKHIYLAVESFVNDNTSPDIQLTRLEYTRCLTLMCNTLRNPKPSTIETPKSRKSPTCSKNKFRLASDRHGDERRKRRATREERMARASKKGNKSAKESSKDKRLGKRKH